ncbi:MAG: hypothetical protein AB7U46_13300 [Paenirhodobacter sp.]|uniref:hypothetical protein n=1 Tax=Paenirhodobacter sp. TaxID=1965326 RepID=UPI003D0ED88E
MRVTIGALVLAALPQLAAAQQFTTAAEVRPILGATKASWVALREYDGQDLIYFTQILSWRCGLTAVGYGFNGAEPTTLLPMEPCHEGTASPNAITGDAIYLRQPPGSVQSLRVRIVYDDGTTEEASYARAQVLMP